MVRLLDLALQLLDLFFQRVMLKRHGLESFIAVIDDGLNFFFKCKNKYREIDNEQGACVYHPGKLKYFSCKQCYADEYFTCCLLCRKCKKGCMVGKHIG